MAEKKAPDYEAWDVEDLDAELLELNNERDVMRDHITGVRAVRDRKANEAAMKARLEAMTDGEREALAQLVNAGSSASKAGKG